MSIAYRRIGLYVIRQRGRECYWARSSEHGCGWRDNEPRQTFSRTELQAEIGHMIDKGWFVDCEIITVAIPITPEAVRNAIFKADVARMREEGVKP